MCVMRYYETQFVLRLKSTSNFFFFEFTKLLKMYIFLMIFWVNLVLASNSLRCEKLVRIETLWQFSLSFLTGWTFLRLF